MVFIPRLDGDTLKFSFHDGTNWVDNMSIPKDSSNKLDIKGSVITGITWNANTFTTRASAADNNWRNVAWAPELGLFVAVAVSGTGDRVMTSPDGITWTSRTSPVDNTWNSITWSPELGLFVAVASSGTGNRIMTSPDGITWTSRTSPVDNDWTSVSWSPKLGLFVAVAETGTSSYTSLKEPAIPLTDNTTVTAVGTYIASSSSEYSTNDKAWEAFNGILTDRWRSSSSYTSGTYNSTNSLGGYIGEWLKLQLPYSVPLKAIRISITGYLLRAPKDGVIIASNDNTNWNLIFTFANEEFKSLNEFKTWTINSTTEYSYYAIVINKVNGEVDVDIGEIELVIPEVVNNIMTSPDGITWTTRASPTYNEWQSVIWAPELESFVATGRVSDGLKLAIAPGYHSGDVDYFETANPVSSVSYVTSLNYPDDSSGIIGTYVSYLITGNFIPDITGTWTFSLLSDDASYMWIGDDALSGYTTGNALINAVSGRTVTTSNTISLTKGVYYPIRILYGNGPTLAALVLTVTNPNGVATTDLTKYVKTNFITSSDGINWTSVNSPNSTYYSNRNHYTADENKLWKSITWAPELKLFVAVSDTETNYTKHPIVGLTANTTTTSFGTYIASASSEYDNNYQAYDAFDGIHTGADPGNAWATDTDSQYRYSGGGGTYSGTSSLGGYSGEWIKLQLPYSIILKRIRIYPRHDNPNQVPNTGVILASNNGTTWSLLHSFSNEVFTADTPKYFEINSTTEYSYYALVVTAVQSTETFLSIGEIELISETKTNILTSPDGINWTTLTSVANNNWQSVTWAPELGLFVAVSYTVRKEPAFAMTANTTVTAVGTYIASASTEINSVNLAYYAFDSVITTENGWLSLDRYNSSTGEYTGSDNLGGYSGEWIKLQLPYSVPLSIFKYKPRYPGYLNRAPKEGVILGSNDNTNWNLLYSFSNQIFTSFDEFKYLNINSTTEYLYYAMVITKNNGDLYTSIGEIQLLPYGFDNIMTSPDGINWTTRSGANDNQWWGITWAPELGLFVAVAVSGTGDRVMTASANTATSSILKVNEMTNSVEISNITVPYDINYNRKLTIRGDTTITGNFYAPGCVVQEISEMVHDIVSYTSIPTAEISPLNIIITPKFINSKIKLEWMINFESNHDNVILIYRKIGSGLPTKIGFNNNISQNNNRNGVAPIPYDSNDASTLANVYLQWVDYPNTLEEVTYYVYFQDNSGGNTNFYLNRSYNGTDENTVSSKSAFEIAQ